MKKPEEQSKYEWLADYDKDEQINDPASPQVIDLHPKTKNDVLKDRLKEAGFILVRHVAGGLLININRHVTNELNNWILKDLDQLATIAESDTGESLYIYSGYRTLFSKKKESLAIEFNDLHTGTFVDRFFNTHLYDTNGKGYKTGKNGKFRIVGNSERPIKDSFIKLWMDSVKHVPDDRPSHICRCVNTKLSNVVVSCDNPVPHHGNIKLTTVKYEGHFYKFP